MGLFDILSKKSPAKILILFLENPTKEMQIKNIIRNTRLARMSVLKWIKEMTRCGILSVSFVGRTSLYSLNKNKPVVKQLRILYNLDYIVGKTEKIDSDAQVFVYGSFARGENTEKSDIDLLVIGKDRNIVKILNSIDKRVKVSFYTPVEWSMTARKDKAFFEGVEKDKIRLR